MWKRFAPIALSLALATAATCAPAASKDFRPAPPQPATTYPLHETHADEHFSIALDPYDSDAKLEGAKAPYLRAGLLPIRVIMTNDSDQPVSLTDLQFQLIFRSDSGRRIKVDEANTDDILRNLVTPDRNPTTPSAAPRLPFPLPKRSKPRVKQEQVDEVQQLRFRAHAVEAHGTQSGFIFFDISGLALPLPGARVYITGLKNAGGGDLLYFEIPLQPANAGNNVQ